MHIVYAGIRKTAWIFLVVPVLACVLQMSAVMAFASASMETDRRTGVEIATAGNVSADRIMIETATVSDAEKLTKPQEEASEESERDLTEEPLLDDLSPIASVSNAEYQPALCAPQISVVVPTQMLFVIEPDGSCTAVSGSLENHGESTVLLTSVTFAWQTEGSKDADDMFTEWEGRKPCLRLTLRNDISCVFGQEQTAAGEAGMTWNLEAEQLLLEPGEELEVSWELELGGNCLAGIFDAGEEAVVAIVTYTVRSLETS